MYAQRAAYKLQAKLDQINAMEKKELKQFSNPAVMQPNSEYYDYFAKQRHDVRARFSKKRDRAIWWYQHSGDVVATTVILGTVLLVVYFLMF